MPENYLTDISLNKGQGAIWGDLPCALCCEATEKGATVFREIPSCSVYWVGCNGEEGRKERDLLSSACFVRLG